MAYEDIADLSRNQSFQSRSTGQTAASLADPFAGERFGYQNKLRTLLENPGSFASSPTYQFAFDQGLEALNRKAAASGMLGSGNRLSELTKYGQGMASQQFFPQANLLARLAGADSGSPAAAGLAYSGAFNRSQDQEQMAQVARAMQRQQQQQPMQQPTTGLPSGGAFPAYSGGSYSGYGSGGYGGYASAYDTGIGAMPSYGSGTGYVESDYGRTDFGSGLPMGGAYTQNDPYQSYDMGGGYTGADFGGYDYGGFDGGSYDTGAYDLGGDYGGGWEDYGGDYYGEEY